MIGAVVVGVVTTTRTVVVVVARVVDGGRGLTAAARVARAGGVGETFVVGPLDAPDDDSALTVL